VTSPDEVFEVPKLARVMTRLILAGLLLMLVAAAVLWWVSSREPRDFLGELEARNQTVLNLDLSPDATRSGERLRISGSGIVFGKPSISSVRQSFRAADGVSPAELRDQVALIAETAGFELRPPFQGSEDLVGTNNTGDLLAIRPSDDPSRVRVILSDSPFALSR